MYSSHSALKVLRRWKSTSQAQMKKIFRIILQGKWIPHPPTLCAGPSLSLKGEGAEQGEAGEGKYKKSFKIFKTC